MTLKNAEIIQRFADGATKGKGNHMEIRALGDGHTIIEGYGWAAYAHRAPDGTITLMDGWRGYSSTTTKHLNLLKPHADHVTDAKPTTGHGFNRADADGYEPLTPYLEGDA